MPLVVPNEGERKMLEYIVNKSSPTNPVLRLYTNEVDLYAEAFSAISFTEASAPGYVAVTLTGSNWSVTTTSGISTAAYATSVTFNFSAAQTLYGYYVTDSAGVVLWAERFPSAPFTLPAGGGEVVVRPQVQLN